MGRLRYGHVPVRAVAINAGNAALVFDNYIKQMTD